MIDSTLAQPGIGSEDQQRFAALVGRVPVGVFLADQSGKCLFVNDLWCDIVGMSQSEALGEGWSKAVHPEDRDRIRAVWRRASRRGEVFAAEYRYVNPIGQVIWVRGNAVALCDETGQVTEYLGTVTDISERRLAEYLEHDRGEVLEAVACDRPLEEVLARLTVMLERQLRDSVACVLLLRNGAIHQIAPRLPEKFVEAVQFRANSISQALCALSTADAPVAYSDLASDAPWQEVGANTEGLGQANLRCCWSLPIHFRDADFWGLLTVYRPRLRPPNTAESQLLLAAAKLAGIAVDHRQMTDQLAHRAQHDALTGLPNRILLDDRLSQALALARRRRRVAGVLAIDLDHFKSINDNFGHATGDRVLQEFSKRLKSNLRESDTLARMGGDEFTIVLPELAHRDDAELVAQKLVNALQAPFEITDPTGKEAGVAMLEVLCSIGISIYPYDGEDAATLQRAADLALYRAKGLGRNRFASSSIAA